MEPPEIIWAVLPERNGAANDSCYLNHLAVASRCGKNGYSLISGGYARTDLARNNMCKTFLEMTKHDNDLLVMLDTDHKYPLDVVEMFAKNDPALGIVGALAYRRGEPYDPLWFVRHNGQLLTPVEYDMGEVYACAIVSTSAISIRRWVLVDLTRKGYLWPWFRYEYPTTNDMPSEDMYFGRICESAGINHHVDTRIEIPHSAYHFIDKQTNADHIRAHPDLIRKGETIKIEAQ
jgi:hypothetical protein